MGHIMKVLHTSDWHLGRSFHGALLISEQREMVDAIVALAIEHAVDAVIIAGDLFDRAIPSLEAVDLWEDAVARLRATGAAVIAIAGNHDSARRVSVHSRVLEAGGVYVRGALTDIASPVVLSGRTSGNEVAIYPLPYLDPVIARGAFGDEAYEPLPDGSSLDDDPAPRRRVTHHSITRAATDLIRADLAERGDPPSIVVAHTFVTGGTPSESEREISLGNLDNVPLGVFDGFSYVALGHLHGPQTFADGRVAYSGSPLPYSFSEERHNKSVHLVTVAADGTASAERVPLELSMHLRTIEGELDDLLADPTLEDAVDAYVRVYLTDVYLPTGAMATIRTRFPKAVELRHRPAGITAPTDLTRPTGAQRRELPPLELVTAFFTDTEGREPFEDELALLTEALEYATRAEQ